MSTGEAEMRQDVEVRRRRRRRRRTAGLAGCVWHRPVAMSAQSRMGLFCTAGLSLRARKFPCVRSGRWMGSRGAVC
jgi:hypothetical protein